MSASGSAPANIPACAADRLFDNVIIPVCSPQPAGNPARRCSEPRDLFHHTLVHIEWSRQGVTWPNWRMWMAAAGVDDFDDSRTVVFGTSSDAVQAAIDGNAVALADFAMVANDLSEGRLVRPFELGIKVPPEFAYFLVYPAEQAGDPRIVAFREWILTRSSRRDRRRRSDLERRKAPNSDRAPHTPHQPMIAPAMTSTPSQWPASISVRSQPKP